MAAPRVTKTQGPPFARVYAVACSRPKDRKQVRTGSILTRHQVDRRILSSSVNLDIEFQPIAFVQATHARAFNRADVDKSVRLPVITGDEAEALHRVEELDCSGRLLTSQLTLLRCFALFNGDDIAQNLQITGRNLPAAVHEGEFQFLTFGQSFKTGTLHRADVDEDIFAAVIALNEAETLIRIEELYSALGLSNDLRRHSAATATAAATTAAAATATAEATAATAAAISAAEASAISAAEAATITAAKPVLLAPKERIEIAFSEPVALVASPTAMTSIKTHFFERTFASPLQVFARPRGRERA